MATIVNVPLTVTGTLASSTGIPSNYKLVENITYPDGKTYTGAAERCLATFSFFPANWPGATWFIDSLIAKHMADKLSAAGAKPLTFKLYESGFDYIMVIEAAKPVMASAVGAIQIAWSVIILAALILAALIVVFFTIKSIEDFVYKTPAAALTTGVIALGIGAIVVLGLAIANKTSVKESITGKSS